MEIFWGCEMCIHIRKHILPVGLDDLDPPCYCGAQRPSRGDGPYSTLYALYRLNYHTDTIFPSHPVSTDHVGLIVDRVPYPHHGSQSTVFQASDWLIIIPVHVLYRFHRAIQLG
jgi:hypothetical protein